MSKRSIICLNDKKVFDKYEEAIKHVNLKEHGGILRCCNNKQNHSGILNGQRVAWMYLDDYEKLTDTEKETIDKNIKEKVPRKVVCLNLNKIFDSLYEAAKWVSEENPDTYITSYTIKKCCEQESLCAGRLNMMKLRWMYLDDYKEFLIKQIKLNHKFNSREMIRYYSR